jgi:hypothetical protein
MVVLPGTESSDCDSVCMRALSAQVLLSHALFGYVVGACRYNLDVIILIKPELGAIPLLPSTELARTCWTL